MTVTLGWWLAPALVSLVGWVSARRICRCEMGGILGREFFDAVTYVVLFVLPSLLAWLIWALLK